MSEPQTIEQQIAELQARAAQLQQRRLVSEQLAGQTPEEKDEGMLRVIGSAMQRRLAEARAAGRTGWWTDQASDADLKQRLQAQIEAGQYLDAVLYAAMLHVRQHLA